MGRGSTGSPEEPKKVLGSIGKRFSVDVDFDAEWNKSGGHSAPSYEVSIRRKHMSPRRMVLLAVPAFLALAAMVTPAEAG